jgi:hypothetical protein
MIAPTVEGFDLFQKRNDGRLFLNLPGEHREPSDPACLEVHRR